MADAPIDWLPLCEVASAPGRAGRLVAWRDGAAVDRTQFLDAVGRWQAAFEQQPMRCWGLFIEDPLSFAAALYGAWHAGKTPCVPGDALPGTVQRLRGMVDGLAGDLPQGLQPAASSGDRVRQTLDPCKTRLVLFTSGSSGEPVALEKKLSQLSAEIEMQHALFGHRWAAHAGLRVHATVSHHHIYGLLFSLLWPLAAGRGFETRRLAYAEEIAEAVAHTPSLLVASPAHLKRLPRQIDWGGARRQLQAVLSSGGPLPPDAALAAAECFGEAPIEVFGSSETGGIASRQRPHDGDLWRPLPGVQCRIDGDGQLCVRSAHLPDERAWWTTTDRASPAADGRFRLLGRADRIAKIEEKRVSLGAVERHLLQTPWIAEARALAVPAGLGLRVGVVYVASEQGRALLESEGRRSLHARLREVLARDLEPVAIPRRWRGVEALPVNAQGKTLEAALKALFTESGAPVMRWLTRGETEARGLFGVDAGHAAFEGHFPGLPILPGVVQLQWAIHWGRECFGLPAGVVRLEALKFQRVVMPGARLTVALRWAADTRVLHFGYESEAGMHASGRVVFA